MTRAEAAKVLHNTAWIGKEGDEDKVNKAIEVLAIPDKAECENGRYISELHARKQESVKRDS